MANEDLATPSDLNNLCIVEGNSINFTRAGRDYFNRRVLNVTSVGGEVAYTIPGKNGKSVTILHGAVFGRNSGWTGSNR